MNSVRAVILAGGFGERTKGMLKDLPKVLIKTADGYTILDHMIHDLTAANITDVVMVTNGRFYPAIASYVQKHYLPKTLTVVTNGKKTPEERLGALGDLLFALDHAMRDERHQSVLVLPSDTTYWESFSIMDVLQFASDHPDSFITVVYDIKEKEKISKNLGCAVLDEHQRIIEFEEKPEYPTSTYAIVAIYLFSDYHIQLLRAFQKSGGDVNSPSNIIPFLMNHGITISAFVAEGNVIDANKPEEVTRAHRYGNKLITG